MEDLEDPEIHSAPLPTVQAAAVMAIRITIPTESRPKAEPTRSAAGTTVRQRPGSSVTVVRWRPSNGAWGSDQDTSEQKAQSLAQARCTSQGGTNCVILGACLLNPGEMGFEPLKPVGEPDAANSRIRFDVRLGGSFAAIVRCTVSEVAKLSPLRVRQGTKSAPGRASRYCGRGRRGPTPWRPSRRRARETDGSRAPA